MSGRREYRAAPCLVRAPEVATLSDFVIASWGSCRIRYVFVMLTGGTSESSRAVGYGPEIKANLEGGRIFFGGRKPLAWFQ